MTYSFAIVVIAAIAVFALFNRYWKNDKKNGKKHKEKDVIPEMERIFLDKVSTGSKMYGIASVYDQYDIMTLKSLLQSEQIPYYFEFENTSRNLIGLPPSAANDTIIKILDADYDDALLVLSTYVENKSTSESPAASGGTQDSGTIEIFKKV